jgi:hypothetical protein
MPFGFSNETANRFLRKRSAEVAAGKRRTLARTLNVVGRMRPERLNTRKMIKRFYRSWWKRPFWLLVVLIVPLVVGRIVLTPLVQEAIRQHLDRSHGPGVVSFRDLDIFLFPPSFLFKDVAIHGGAPGGGSGDDLVVDRLEVHVASLRELVAPVPRVRLRMVRPRLQLHPGAHDLERVARALPTARVEVTGFEGGSINAPTSETKADGKAILDGMNGDIEGIATGAEVGRGGWQIWADGRLFERSPFHAFVKLEPTGAWQGTVTLQENPRPSLATTTSTANLAMSVDARFRGLNARIQAKIHAGWAGETPPRVVAEDMLRALPESWPGVTLIPVELKAGPASVGQSVDLVAETDASKVDARLRAFDLVGLLINMLRLTNQAVLPPPAGMATLTETPDSAVPAQEAP